MIFMFHAAFCLGLIALTAGVALYVASVRAEGVGTGFAKWIGLLVIISALVSLVCTAYCGVKYAYPIDMAKMHEMQRASMMGNTEMMNNQEPTSNTKKPKHH